MLVGGVMLSLNKHAINNLPCLLFRHIFKFKSGKIFVANAEEYKNTRLDTAAEFSLRGDNFYLVFYNDSPNKIILLFSSKTYNYKAEK